jgi:hypothetical protein
MAVEQACFFLTFFIQVRIPHEFFVLLYDFIFEAEKKAFLQVMHLTRIYEILFCTDALSSL